MFQFPRFASQPYGFRPRYQNMTPDRFPHSGIPGSRPVCGSPRLIAAYHALRRFLAPRHPPYALSNLTTEMDHLARDSVHTFSGCQRARRVTPHTLSRVLVEMTGFEPATPCLQSRCSPS